jgi:hydrogenase maturation factor HypF (carbamoyltransferase family)
MAGPQTISRKRLKVTGVVQGVGFRPFVYRLAVVHDLAGWICDILVDLNNEQVIARVKSQVLELCARFPVYG